MKILIADRSEEIRRRIKHLLDEIYSDPEVFETESNIEAIRIVDLYKPNVIITDLDLKCGSGLSLLTFLNVLPSHSIKIVFTNHTQNKMEEVSLKLGADYFLAKSHEFREIRKILKDKNNFNNNAHLTS